MKDRIQLIKEAAERLKTQKLETTTKQALPFEVKRAQREQAIRAVGEKQPNNIHCIGKNGVRTTYQTSGHYPTMQVFRETNGRTSVEGDTQGYRHDY